MTSRSRRRRSRAAATAASVVAHVALFGAVLLTAPKVRRIQDAPVTTVAFLDVHPRDVPKPISPRPVSPKPPAGKTAVATPVAPPPRSLVRAVTKPLSMPASTTLAAAPSAELSESEIAGAATTGGAGGGGGGGEGGACNMLARLQAGLRKDQLVQAATRSGASGRAVRVWNGDWVQGAGEEGRGMAAVREAILWEVGFAPKGCRDQRVHGLVLVSLNDAPGAPRIVLGGADWRWSDMLALRSAPR